MRDIDSTLDAVRSTIERYFADSDAALDPDDPSVPLARASFGADEVMDVLDSLLSTHVTMGDKVAAFEQAWSTYVGAAHGVMVNSGSSANLLALKTIAAQFDDDAEVIVPAVAWSTTVFPIIDAGARPVFVDVDPDRLMIDPDALTEAVTDDTAAILPVHLLGYPAPMDTITDLCTDHDLALVEDCCEAHGATFNDQHVGTFGDIGTFSFSFSHHITTTEGGMAVTDASEYRSRMQMLRSWGRVRDVDDPKFRPDDAQGMEPCFASHGYNVRPTELQGAFGVHQTEKMDGIVKQRQAHADTLTKRLAAFDELLRPDPHPDGTSSYLHHPLILSRNSGRSRDELREHLEARGIETRPILSGDITRHPVFQDGPGRVDGDRPGATHIHEHGLYISNHQYLTDDHIDHIVDTVSTFFHG